MATGEKLNKTLRDFIEAQHVFFVATAAPDGRVNLSPKGMDTLRIASDTQIIWLNFSGSGNETAAHIRILPRMTLMFCAFEGEAKILRVYGAARMIAPSDAEWGQYIKGFPQHAASRQIFVLDIERIQISCGTGVPIMVYEKNRGEEELLPFFEEMGAEGVKAYWRRKNTTSIDGFDTGILKET